ncbi:acyltransferase family protein [Campylobacter concisus]|jgi:putative membrane localised acyltransferase protein|uniref:acyltransferase family protein n=1 Tax=Campylobacter concisus TaxID=199 RepID=UPI003D1A8CBC
MGRNLEIDRLRAVAVLMVIWAHIDILFFNQVSWYPDIRQYTMGENGVMLFFVISGFVISKTLIKSIDKAKFESKSIKNVIISFFIKRLTRITPMAVLWIIITLLCTAFLNKSNVFGYMEYNIRGGVAAALNIFNFYNTYYDHGKSIFGVYWTLSVEEQFYIIFPFFLILFTNIKLRIILLLITLYCVVFVLPFELFSIIRAEGIIAGILLYLIFDRNVDKTNFYLSKLGGKVFYNLATIALIFILFVVCRLLNSHHTFIVTSLLSSSFLVFLAIQNKGYILSYYIISGFLDWVGTRSFCLYLAHTIYFRASFAFLYDTPYNTPIWRSLISIVLTIFVTEIFYKIIEEPIRKYGRNYTKKHYS